MKTASLMSPQKHILLLFTITSLLAPYLRHERLEVHSNVVAMVTTDDAGNVDGAEGGSLAGHEKEFDAGRGQMIGREVDRLKAVF